MSKYTITLNQLIDVFTFPYKPFKNNDEKIKKGCDFLFDFDYPFYKDNKKEFESKIIKHFYFDEIGFETVEMFKFELNEKLNLIMPKYNEIFKTLEKNYNFLDEHEYVESEKNSSSQNGTTKQNNNSVSNNSSNYNEKFLQSDYPQSPLSDGDYATGSTNTINSSNDNQENNSNSTGESQANSKNDLNKLHKGNSNKSKTELKNEYINSLFVVEQQIFNELQSLFMMIY